MYDEDDDRPPWEQPNGSGDWIVIAIVLMAILTSILLGAFFIWWPF